MILEYCALGNLKSHMIDHYKEFKENIKTTKEETNIADVSEHNKHTIDLLMLWSYQVQFITRYSKLNDLRFRKLFSRNNLNDLTHCRSPVGWSF